MVESGDAEGAREPNTLYTVSITGGGDGCQPWAREVGSQPQDKRQEAPEECRPGCSRQDVVEPQPLEEAECHMQRGQSRVLMTNKVALCPCTQDGGQGEYAINVLLPTQLNRTTLFYSVQSQVRLGPIKSANAFGASLGQPKMQHCLGWARQARATQCPCLGIHLGGAIQSSLAQICSRCLGLALPSPGPLMTSLIY